MDVDHLLQYLIPVIFLIIWVIGRIFSPKPHKDTTPSHTPRPIPMPFDQVFDEVYQSDADEEERKLLPKRAIAPINLPQSKQYPGNSLARVKDINALSKSFILNELDSLNEFKRTKQNSEIRALLRGPHALRNAFLTCEILGQPLCLRKNGKIGRSWQR